MPKRNTVFAPAIAALESDLADHEHQAAETRALIKALTAYAGIAGKHAAPPGEPAVPSSVVVKREIEPIEQAEAKKRQREHGKTAPGRKHSGEIPPSVKGRALDKVAKIVGKDRKTITKAADQAAAEELRKVVAAIAEAASRVAAAKRDKNAEKLRDAVAAWEQAERRAGELLITMNRRVMRLPGAEPARRRWRIAARLSASEFAKKVELSTSRALFAIGAGPAPPKRAPRSAPRSPPKPEMKLTPWTAEPDGSLSRTLTGVDAEGAEAP